MINNKNFNKQKATFEIKNGVHTKVAQIFCCICTDVISVTVVF